MWGLLIFVVGLLYGWLTPGRQDKGRLFMNGLVIGLILAVLLALLGGAINANPLPVGTGIVGTVLTVVVLTVVFILGAWLGDLLEGNRSSRYRRIP